METATLRMLVDSTGSEVAARNLNRMSEASNRAEHNVNRLGRESVQVSEQLRRLANIMKLVAGSYIANEILRMADTMKQAEAQIKLVTKATDDYRKIMNDVMQVANRTYSSFDSMTSLYTRTSRAMSHYGKSAEEVLKFTESVANAMRIGRASTSEQAAAMMQLSQALASGRLQGDEFRSLMETAPILMEQLAKSLGLTTHQLRVLASEGKLTTQTIYKAIHGSAAELAEMASKIPPSFGEAMQVLFNNLTVLVGELDKATGFTDSLSISIVWLGNHLKDIAFVSGAAAIGWLTGMIGTIGGATGAVGLLSGAFATLTNVMRTNPFGLVLVSVATLIAYLGETGDALYLLGSIASSVAAGFAAVWYDAAMVFNELWSTAKTVFSNIEKNAQSSASNSGSSFSDFFESTGGGFWGVIETAATVFDMLAAVTRTTYSYMFSLIEGFGKSVGNVWNNIKVSILESVKGFLDGIINGLNQLPDWMLPDGGIGPVNISTGTRVEDAFKPFNDVSFDKVMEDAFLLQSSEGMAAAVRRLKEEQEQLKKAKKEATGGRSNNHGDLIEDIGGRSKTGKSAAERALQDFHRQLSSMVQEAMQLSDTIEQMQMNNGLVSAFHQVTDLQIEMAANAEKYKNYTQEQTNALLEQAGVLDRLAEKKAVMEFATEHKQRLDDMRFEIELIGKTAEEIDRLRFIRELNLDAQRRMAGASEEGKAAIEAEIDALAGLRDELERQRAAREAAINADWLGGVESGVRQAYEQFGSLNKLMESGTVRALNTVGDAFGDFATKGKMDVRSMTISILEDFARMFAKIAVMKAAAGLLGSFGGSAAGSFAGISAGASGYAGMSTMPTFANGGAFSNGVEFFANGGIVDQPTLFGMSGGRKGVMGEAGAEAIMPLSRGRDGKLGVKFDGNGGQQVIINQTTIINADGSSESDADGAQQVATAVKMIVSDELQREMRPGGKLNEAIKRIK
ncbi:tape measure protein [Cardiobacteriaceae bacterium TAE3-ERU3]|nr:tape measure protein [Cardiobacteriaceae bacterium TAE3-ERU3]